MPVRHRSHREHRGAARREAANNPTGNRPPTLRSHRPMPSGDLRRRGRRGDGAPADKAAAMLKAPPPDGPTPKKKKNSPASYDQAVAYANPSTGSPSRSTPNRDPHLAPACRANLLRGESPIAVDRSRPGSGHDRVRSSTALSESVLSCCPTTTQVSATPSNPSSRRSGRDGSTMRAWSNWRARCSDQAPG